MVITLTHSAAALTYEYLHTIRIVVNTKEPLKPIDFSLQVMAPAALELNMHHLLIALGHTS
jgi:hypothetical protein